MASVSGLALLAMFAMVVGPSASGAFVESSPFHSHVYLSAKAAQMHGISTTGHGDSSDVVSTTDHSGVSSAATVHIVTPGSESFAVRLSTFVQRPITESEYSDPLLRPPDQPPQYS